MQGKKGCPCQHKRGKKGKATGRANPVKAPTSTRVTHSKSSVKVAEPNLNRGRIQYKF